MKIGISVMGSRLGRSGGLDIYARSLVEALTDYDQYHTYVIFINKSDADAWNYRQWPAHSQFVLLNYLEPRQSLRARVLRRFRHTIGLTVLPNYGEEFFARQINEIDLALIYYPGPTIYPFSTTTPCVLGLSDLQQEYYPQYFSEAELQNRAKRYKASTERALHIIVPSQYTKHTLIDKYATPNEKITVIPHGITSIFRRASPDEIHRVRVQYNLSDRYIFYPANPWPHKNHARLMAALRIYQDRYDDPIDLVLSGRLSNEPRDATLLAIAASVDNRVIDLGFVPQEDLPALYSSATLMAFPSIFEGFGYPLVEAMACGCPIVAANATSIPEITNGAALLFDPFDPEAIANAIHRLINNPALCTELVEKGYRQIGRFDWQTIIPQLISVYEHEIG